MKRLPLRLPPVLYILIFNQFHMANVINGIGMSMFAVDRFSAGDVGIGTLGAVMMFAYGSFAWAGGLLADRYPKRLLIPCSMCVLALVFWTIPYARSLSQLIGLAAFCSIVYVTIMPSNFGLIAESVRHHRVSRFLGFNALILVFAGTAAAFFVGRLYESGGPVRAYHTAAAITVAALLFAIVCAPRNEHDEPSHLPVPPPGTVPPEPDVPPQVHGHARGFLVAALALNFLGFYVGVTHQHFLVRLATLPELDLTLPQQSNIQSVRMLGSALGYLAGVAWTGWHWRRWPFWMLGGLMTVVTLLGGLAPNAIVLAAAIGLGGMGAAMCNQISLYYAIGSGVVKRGRGAGLTESALAIGGGCGPLLGGLAAVLAGTPRGALFAALLPIAACAALWLKVLPAGAPRPAATPS